MTDVYVPVCPMCDQPDITTPSPTGDEASAAASHRLCPNCGTISSQQWGWAQVTDEWLQQARHRIEDFG
jgi:hypothetical protein